MAGRAAGPSPAEGSGQGAQLGVRRNTPYLPCAGPWAGGGKGDPLGPGAAAPPNTPTVPFPAMFPKASGLPRAEPSLGVAPALVGSRGTGSLTFPRGHPACRAGHRRAAASSVLGVAVPALWISPPPGQPALSPASPALLAPGSVNPRLSGGQVPGL